jgi:hypothetical protein
MEVDADHNEPDKPDSPDSPGGAGRKLNIYVPRTREALVAAVKTWAEKHDRSFSWAVLYGMALLVDKERRDNHARDTARK